MSLKKKIHTDQMDWFPWRKKPNISSYFYNVYVSVFLVYFLWFFFNDWLVVVFMKILESSALHVCQYSFCLLFMLTSQFIPSKADVVYNSAYSNCCCWQLRHSTSCWRTAYSVCCFVESSTKYICHYWYDVDSSTQSSFCLLCPLL